jgi:D-alanyl-D-alanine carboxypeptidase
VYAKGFGLADTAAQVAVAPETRFAIGSLTKGFTAASVLLLAQRGMISIDDPLATYLPAFPNAAAITLRMLLHQTSGLHTYPLLAEHPWPLSGPIPLETVVSILATDAADFSPGTRWAYSNTNYALLSAVIAQASGLDAAAFLQREIFTPLALTDCGYGYVAQRQPGLATAYDGCAPFEVQSPISLDLAAGAGAMISSARDMVRWDIALLRGALLDESSTRMLWSAGTLRDGTPVDYAMGFVPTDLGAHRAVWHNGLAPGAGGYCYNAVFPDDDLAIVVLSNGSAFSGVPELMVTRVLKAYDPDGAGKLVAPAAAAGDDPAITARAKDWWHRLQSGTVDLTDVAPAFAAHLTPAFLAQIQVGLSTAGEPTDWIFLGSQELADATVYRYSIRLDGTPHVWSVGLTADGKIAGSRLQ